MTDNALWRSSSASRQHERQPTGQAIKVRRTRHTRLGKLLMTPLLMSLV